MKSKTVYWFLREMHLLITLTLFATIYANLLHNLLDKTRKFEIDLLSLKPYDNKCKSLTDYVNLESSFDLNNCQYHGTTTIAFKYKNSVLICVDSRASIGNYVGSRTVKKVFPISKTVVATMAGGAADCAYWIRQVGLMVKLIEMNYGESVKVSTVARLLSSNLREYKGYGITQQHF
jgi:20S proteasome alpha/beta subunit